MNFYSNGLGIFVIPIKFNLNTNTYKDYLDFLVQAENWGYTDVYIGEHLTDHREDIQSSLIFAAALAARTSSLRISLCALPLPHYNMKLLVKQLEDLYRLSSGRINIGFTPGALKKDLEYLDIDATDRTSIFNEKLIELIACLQSSEVLSDIYPSRMFATLLAGRQEGCKKVFNTGFSAFSSNFVHPEFLNDHASYLRTGLTNVSPLTSRWNVGVNLVPVKEVSKNSLTIIKESLHYIYNKLYASGLENLMLAGRRDSKLIDSRELKNILFNNFIYESIPHNIRKTVDLNKDIFGQYVINLFDCVDDNAYMEALRLMPKRLIKAS